MQNLRTKAKSSYLDFPDLSFEDEVEETEMRENVENYPGTITDEDGAAVHNIFSSQKYNSFYGDLEGINRPNANFHNRQLPFVNINSSEFRYGNFEMANMVCSSIDHSNLQGANLRYVDMEYSEITKTNLSGADLSYANLRGCQIRESDFSGADLRGADLADCTVHNSKFQEAVFDEHTQLPFDKSQAKRLGMVFVSKRNAG